MTLYKWSQTASADATADSTINWAEGQSPSSVNDSARAMMAATAKYRDDISGYLGTGGTSTALTLATNQGFDSLVNLHAKVIAFTMNVTNGAGPVTLNVDGLGAKPIQATPGVDLPAGVLIQGTPYVAIYNNVANTFYLQSFFGNPYSIPIGSSVDFWGATAPNSSFVLAYGQAISRTTYASLFSLLGTTYGTGDGSTTFNVPDLRGRVIAGRDDMGGSAASRLTSTYFGTSAAALGAAGGSQSHTLTVGELPTGITSANASQAISVTSTGSNVVQGTLTSSNAAGGPFLQLLTGSSGSVTSTGSNSISVTSNNTSGSAHSIVPPTIIANKLLRII